MKGNSEEDGGAGAEQLEPDADEQVQQRRIGVVIPDRLEQPVRQQLLVDELHVMRESRSVELQSKHRIQCARGYAQQRYDRHRAPIKAFRTASHRRPTTHPDLFELRQQVSAMFTRSSNMRAVKYLTSPRKLPG
jgi:hypothetical protein